MAIAWMYRDDYGKAGFPMLPVIEPDGRRAGRQAVLYAARCSCRSAWCRRWCGLSRRRLLWRRARPRRRAVRAVARASPPIATSRSARRAVLRLDHLPAAALGRDDRQQAVTVHDLPAVNATPQRALRRPAAHRLRADPDAPHRAAPRGHDRRVHHLVAVPGLLSRLSRAGRIGAVPAPGFVRPLYFTILITHVTLAATVPPLAIVTLSRGLKGALRAAPRASRAGRFRSGSTSR